jgi:hypothetical protein
VLKGLLASAVVVTVVALCVNFLGSDLWAVLAGQDADATAAVAGAGNAALPVDAPAVTRLRSKDQESTSATATSSGQQNVLVLDDWDFTQSSGSPFLFDAPNGFDFFNPLFAFNNFGGGSSNGATNGMSPFGFTTTPTTTFPSTTGGSGGTTTAGTTGSGGTSGGAGSDPPATTTTTSTTTGVSITTSFSIGTAIIPFQLGTGGGFSHRHVFTPIIIVINISITITVTVSASS